MEELEELKMKLSSLLVTIPQEISKIQRPKSSKLGKSLNYELFICIGDLHIHKITDGDYCQYVYVTHIDMKDGGTRPCYTYFSMTDKIKKLIDELREVNLELCDKIQDELNLPTWIQITYFTYPDITINVFTNKLQDESDFMRFDIKYNSFEDLESLINNIRCIFESDSVIRIIEIN